MGIEPAGPDRSGIGRAGAIGIGLVALIVALAGANVLLARPGGPPAAVPACTACHDGELVILPVR